MFMKELVDAFNASFRPKAEGRERFACPFREDDGSGLGAELRSFARKLSMLFAPIKRDGFDLIAQLSGTAFGGCRGARWLGVGGTGGGG